MKHCHFKFGQPLHKRKYQLRPGSYGALIDRHSQILAPETQDGAFYLPGGGTKKGETAEETVIREFLEETGLQVSCAQSIGTASQFVHCLDQPHGYEKICSFFLINPVHQILQANGEYRCHWLSLSQIKASLHEEAHRWAIGRFLAQSNSKLMPS